MATAQYPEQVAGKEIVGDCVVVFRQWGVPHCLLPCSFGGAGDGVRTGVSTFLMFLTPNAEPHWFIL